MLRATALSGFGVAKPKIAKVTWSETLATNFNLIEYRSHRNLASSLAFGGTEVRVRFQSSDTEALSVDNASIGIRTGSASDTVSTPVELLFSGGSGFDIGTSEQITSDWVALTTTTSDVLVVVIDFAAVNGGIRFSSTSGDDTYYRTSYDSYNLASVTGFALASANTICSNQIEVR